MPLNSTLQYMKSLLNNLPMPGGIPNMAVYISPPAVDDEPFGEPRGYLWPATFEESRNPERGGSVNRALSMPQPGGNPASGVKPIDYSIHLYILYDEANDDVNADSLFPTIIDTINWTLRVSTDPAVTYDANTGLTSQLIDVGESINGQITVRALASQRMFRYDALLILPVMELIQS